MRLRRSWTTPAASLHMVPRRSRCKRCDCVRRIWTRLASSSSVRFASSATRRWMARVWYTCSLAWRTASRMSSGCQGFFKNRKTRARLIAEISAGGSVKPVRMMPATSGLNSRTLSSSSTPVISGMRWSEMITSSAVAFAISSASFPDCASWTRYPASRKFRRTVRLGLSSSTMRIPPLRVSPTPCRAMSERSPSSSIGAQHRLLSVVKATFDSGFRGLRPKNEPEEPDLWRAFFDTAPRQCIMDELRIEQGLRNLEVGDRVGGGVFQRRDDVQAADFLVYAGLLQHRRGLLPQPGHDAEDALLPQSRERALQRDQPGDVDGRHRAKIKNQHLGPLANGLEGVHCRLRRAEEQRTVHLVEHHLARQLQLEVRMLLVDELDRGHLG